MKKISFIIPVKNGEKYIKRCLNSILSQDCDNYEVLVIDNNSTDNTKKIILNEFSSEKIKYFYLKKSGVSLARNYGLKVATGEYIIFIDVDDYIEKNTISTINDYLDQNYDVIKFNYYLVKENKIPYLLFKNDYVFSSENKDELFELMFRTFKFNQLWGQAIRRECLKDLFFDENLKMAEDYLFNYSLYKNCCKIICLKDVLYNYEYNLNGINYNVTKEKIFSKINDIIYVDNLIYKDSHNQLLKTRIIDEVIPHIINYYAYAVISDDKYDVIKSLKENAFFCESMKVYKKMNINKFIIICIQFNFYWILIRILRLKRIIKRR